jgi:hypothetical protein
MCGFSFGVVAQTNDWLNHIGDLDFSTAGVPRRTRSPLVATTYNFGLV